MSLVLLTVKLDPNIRERFLQRAKDNGTSGSDLIRGWIDRYLQDTTATQSDRVASIEARLDRIETQLAKLDQSRPVQDATHIDRFSMPLQANLGGLTTAEAHRLACDRGCQKSKEAFRSWSRRNPQECERLYGLKVLENSSRDNTLPSYQKVWE